MLKKFHFVAMATRVFDGIKFREVFNPFPNKPLFLRVCSTSLLKTLWEKETLLVTSKFSFSHSVFYQFRKLCHFHQIRNCCLHTLSVWKNQKFVVLERVKEELPRNIPAKFDLNWLSHLGGEDVKRNY